MKCAFCIKPIRFWQSKAPLGPGPLPMYGQYEHMSCHEKRDQFIEDLESLPKEQRQLHDEAVGVVP